MRRPSATRAWPSYVNKHFYPVKFNAESGTIRHLQRPETGEPGIRCARATGRNGTHQLTYAIANVQGRIAYPTVVYIDSDLNVLAPVQGYLTPDQMEPILNYFGEAHYKAKDYQTFMGDVQAEMDNAVSAT